MIDLFIGLESTFLWYNCKKLPTVIVLSKILIYFRLNTYSCYSLTNRLNN